MVDKPSGSYDLVYADPPWRYDFQATGNRDIENHYPTMEIDSIKELDVPAADESVCYMWATNPKLKEGIETLEAWGFEYKTNAVWDKRIMGQGYWFRGQHELLLVGTRGGYSPPQPGDRRTSVFEQKRGRHSSKPKSVKSHIEQAHPEADKIELFSRDNRVGWDVWGNEAPETQQDVLTTW